MQSQNKTRKWVKNGSDVLLVVFSFLAAAWLAKRHAGMASGFFRQARWEIYLLLFFPLAWNFGARIFELYDEFHNRLLRQEMIAIGKNIVLQAFFAVLVLFFAKTWIFSRFFVFAYCLFLLVTLFLWRIFLSLFFSWQQKNGRNLSQLLIIGNGALARNFADTVGEYRHLGYRVRGFLAAEPCPWMGDRYLGDIDQLAALLDRDKIDDVIITLPLTANAELERVATVCENYPVQVRIIPEYHPFLNERFRVSRFGSFPVFSLRAMPLDQAQWRFSKRGFDLVVSALAFLFVFSWLWPLLALLIKATSPGPVFFKQERWGEKNKRILCYKFRTMVRESRDVDENGRYQQARQGDPRVTRLGRFLRRSNLDELPQFINVVKGDMSIIGPRPHPTPMNLEAKDVIPKYRLRHLIKPGITGLAQVNGLRGDASDPEVLRQRVAADICYIENWSFALDLKITWLTLRLMLKGDPHAY